MSDVPAEPARPPSRYGSEPIPSDARRWVVRGLAALTVLATLAIAVVAYQRFEGVAVEGKTAAFEVLDDQTVEVTISVTRKDPATPVTCIVRARAYDGAETGRREVLVGPAAERTIQITTTVKSYRRPAVGDVYGCGTVVPPYLTAP
ncbi:MAG: DUF4307 domain-containing protein [Mycobacterium sp.]